jgi:hypothetical protein
MRIAVDVTRSDREQKSVLKQQSINGYGLMPVFYVDWDNSESGAPRSVFNLLN